MPHGHECQCILTETNTASQSKTREAIKNAPLVRTGKAAFRFLIPTCVAENNPETASLVSHPDTLTTWFADKRRIVMYPCQNNEWLNFVCIYPDADSPTFPYNGKTKTVSQLLQVRA